MAGQVYTVVVRIDEHMKLTTLVSIVLVGLLLHVRTWAVNGDSLQGQWSSTSLDRPNKRTVLDYFTVFQNSYVDSVVFQSKESCRMSSLCKGTYSIRQDTIYLLDTLILDSKGRRIPPSSTASSNIVIRVSRDTLVIEGATGVDTMVRIKRQ